jgi:uncharacterized membrane protein (UPF0127 family)
VVGLGMMLLGVVLIATSILFDGETTTEVATPTTAIGPYGPDMSPGTTAPLVDGGLGRGTAAERDGRAPLGGFGEVQATIRATDGEVCEVCLLSATTPEQRERGLMEVTDPELGGYDGMLFEYPTDTEGGFWMRNTPMPLSIAYFDEGGTLIEALDMEPCDDSADCPTYPSSAPFQFALEALQGELAEMAVRPGSTITINDRSCTAAPGGA